ncbi:AEC family transporter [Arsukibacterium sp.]|uniref:AEC family transporter n=1 Tax=Arsukibacterium sp. TaxID=1977258 RepID=UPI002FD8ECE8
MLLFTLIPDFIVLLCGSALKRVLPPGSWQSIDKLNFYLLFPALIFISALQSPPGSSALVLIGTGVWGIMLFAFAVGFLLRSIGPARFLDFAACWQTAWRFNAALALVMVQALPLEYRALMSIAIGLAVPVANILAISVLSKGQGLGLAKTCWLILSNPFLVASVAGLFFALSALSIPALLLSALHKLAQAAIPLALLSIGAALNWQALYKVTGFDAALNGIKLLLMPAVMLLLCQLGTVATGPAMVLVLFAALPTASAAHVLASVYGAKREPVATLIAQSTLLGCFTLPMWLLLLQVIYL